MFAGWQGPSGQPFYWSGWIGSSVFQVGHSVPSLLRDVFKTFAYCVIVYLRALTLAMFSFLDQIQLFSHDSGSDINVFDKHSMEISWTVGYTQSRTHGVS